MRRTKERREIIHEPSTHEILQCLRSTPIYSKILLGNGPEKPFTGFLRWLIAVNFYSDQLEKTSIKKIATDFKTDPSKVTRGLQEIYNAIFELNDCRPELFQGNGINVCLCLRSYDNFCCFYISMPAVPSEFERIRFPFVNGKVGIDIFWVKEIEHAIIDVTTEITVWAEGGFVNKYREYALEKALFQGWIGSWDIHEKHSFEIKEELKKNYRD